MTTMTMLAMFEGVSGDEVKNFVIIVAGLVGLAVGIKTLMKKQVPMQQPLTVVEIKELATRKELQRVEHDLEARIAESDGHRVAELKGLRDEIGSMAHSFREAVGRTHGRIDGLAERSSELKGSVDAMNENLGRLIERSMKARG